MAKIQVQFREDPDIFQILEEQKNKGVGESENDVARTFLYAYLKEKYNSLKKYNPIEEIAHLKSRVYQLEKQIVNLGKKKEGKK